MQIPPLWATPSGPPARLPESLVAAARLLTDSGGAVTLIQQLGAYQSLALRWREARPLERQALAPALTQSPFALRVQSTLDAFTRAAWAGPDAVPPLPQQKMLEAFERLSSDDQEIIARVSGDSAVSDYRSRLQAQVEALTPRPVDTVTLSPAAQAHLAGAPGPAPQAPPIGVAPERAAAIAAYGRLAG